jgi:hypothetical protein
MNDEKCYEEFFYKEFIPNVDYIEVLYSDNENGEIIIDRINNAIKNTNCEEMAMKCYLKAKKIFNEIEKSFQKRVSHFIFPSRLF